MNVVALVAFPLAALVAALLHAGDLRPATPTVVYATAVALGGAPVALIALAPRRPGVVSSTQGA